MRQKKNGNLQKGSVVLVALCFVAVLGIALASYMAVSSQALKLSNRSYLKGISEQLAETGLEHALWALNHRNWSNWNVDSTTHIAKRTIPFPTTYGNGTIGSLNLRVENYDSPISSTTEWKNALSYSPAQVVTYRGSCGWASGIAFVAGDVVSFQNLKYRCIQANSGHSPDLSPTFWNLTTEYVDFRGWYRCTASSAPGEPPSNSAKWANIAPVIFAEGTVTSPSEPKPTVTQLMAHISVASLFPNAVGAISTLNLTSSGQVDSYDSLTDPTESYPPGYSAILASDGSANPSVTVTSANVQGYVAANSSAVYASLTAFGGSASLKKGVVASPHPTAPNVDLTRISRSPFIPQFPVAVWNASSRYIRNDVVRSGTALYRCRVAGPTSQPTTVSTDWRNDTPLSYVTITGGPLAGSTSTIRNYSYSETTDLDLDGMTITIVYPTILDVRGSLIIRNGGGIVIQGNGSVEIHFSGQLQIESSAGGGIDNQTKDPKNLLLARSADNPSTIGHFLNGSASVPFYGAIYMPNSSLSIGASSVIYGAITAKNVTFPGPANVHYDTSLKTATFHSIDTPCIITNWRELIDPAEKVLFP